MSVKCAADLLQSGPGMFSELLLLHEEVNAILTMLQLLQVPKRKSKPLPQARSPLQASASSQRWLCGTDKQQGFSSLL
jgi:hypothetical protein